MNNYTWSYEKKNLPDAIKAEHILKYGDIDEISELINIYGIDFCKNIWIKKIIPDSRFNRLNYFLARFIFKISTDRKEILEYLKKYDKKRFDRL